MAERPDVSIVVVSFNTRDVTLECLRSVYRETHDFRFELIVVDNASQDGSAKAIAAEFPQATLIPLDENLGFGGANNLAAKRATGEFLMLLNPDTVVLNQAIDRLLRFAHATPDARIWGGRTLFADGSLNRTSCWRSMSLWGLFCWATGLTRLSPNSPLFNYDGYGGWKRDTVRRVDTVSGCFFLMARRDWDELGGFDPKFYMYGEEADLCMRARQKGARPMMTPDAEIIHHGGLSETVRAAKMQRLLRAKISFAEKHWSPIGIWACRRMFWMLVGIRALAFNVRGGISAHPDAKDKAATWRELWRDRANWLEGYSGVN